MIGFFSVVDKSPYHAARAMPFSARALKKNCFDVDIVVKNKSKCGLAWSVLLSTTSTLHYSSPKDFFFFLFLRVQRVCKVLERKVGRVLVVICIMQHVHFQVRVGVFSCQQILTIISFVIFDIVVKKNNSNVV